MKVLTGDGHLEIVSVALVSDLAGKRVDDEFMESLVEMSEADVISIPTLLKYIDKLIEND